MSVLFKHFMEKKLAGDADKKQTRDAPNPVTFARFLCQLHDELKKLLLADEVKFLDMKEAGTLYKHEHLESCLGIPYDLVQARR